MVTKSWLEARLERGRAILAPAPATPYTGAMDRTLRFAGAEPMRVNKWLAAEGVCSRREAESLIAQGLIRIDGEVIQDLGRKIAPGQVLVVAGAGDQILGAQATFVLHKPIGYVSAQPEAGQIPAARLITRDRHWGSGHPAAGGNLSLAPLGRLDADSRGLLLLSEDGALAKAIIGPTSPLSKAYEVRVAGRVTVAKLKLLRQGLHLDGRALKPAVVEEIGPQLLSFVLQEGRNRQIRRMCELVELRVTDLLRWRIGPLQLGDLPEGRWRLLSREERDGLISAAKS
jgi:23S rRNA pseudouridine2604 synthase